MARRVRAAGQQRAATDDEGGEAEEGGERRLGELCSAAGLEEAKRAANHGGGRRGKAC